MYNDPLFFVAIVGGIPGILLFYVISSWLLFYLSIFVCSKKHQHMMRSFQDEVNLVQNVQWIRKDIQHCPICTKRWLRFVKAALYFFLSLSIFLIVMGIVAAYIELQEGRVTGIGVVFILIGGYILFFLIKGKWGH